MARVRVGANKIQSGNWQLVLHKPTESSLVYIVLDPKLPQWIFPDTTRTLKITPVP